jgi:hypothetical protein
MPLPHANYTKPSNVVQPAPLSKAQAIVLTQMHETFNKRHPATGEFDFARRLLGSKNLINEECLIIGQHHHKGRYGYVISLNSEDVTVEISSAQPPVHTIPYECVTMKKHDYAFSLTGRPTNLPKVLAASADALCDRPSTPPPNDDGTVLTHMEMVSTAFSSPAPMAHNHDGLTESIYLNDDD